MLSVRCVIPAAGLSRRFGGPNKLLAPFGDASVVATTVRNVVAAGVEPLVVTGRDSQLIAAEVHPVECVHNSNFEEGLGSTIAHGVRSLRGCDGIMIVLADMPGISPDIVRMAVEAFERYPANSIIATRYPVQSHPGHPIIFASCYRAELESLSGDLGARQILAQNADRILWVSAPIAIQDIDLPGDLE